MKYYHDPSARPNYNIYTTAAALTSITYIAPVQARALSFVNKVVTGPWKNRFDFFVRLRRGPKVPFDPGFRTRDETAQTFEP